MTDKIWKATERAVARILGGRRVPITGRRGAPDIREAEGAAPWPWAVEIKHRRDVPAWLRDALSQAVAAAEDGQVPIVVVHEENRPHLADLVVLRLGDFRELFGTHKRADTQRCGDDVV